MRRVGRLTTNTNSTNTKHHSNNVIKSNTYYTPNLKQLQSNKPNTTLISNTVHTYNKSPSFRTPGIPKDLNDSLIINENVNPLVLKTTTLDSGIINIKSHSHSNTFPDRPKHGKQNQTLTNQNLLHSNQSHIHIHNTHSNHTHKHTHNTHSNHKHKYTHNTHSNNNIHSNNNTQCNIDHASSQSNLQLNESSDSNFNSFSSIPTTPTFGTQDLSINNNESLYDIIEKNKQIENNINTLDGIVTASQLTPLIVNRSGISDSNIAYNNDHYDDINYIDNQHHLMDLNDRTTNGMDSSESDSNNNGDDVVQNLNDIIDAQNSDGLLNNTLNESVINYSSSNASHELNDEKDLELNERTPEPTNRNLTEAPRTIYRSMLRHSNHSYRDHISSGRITKWYCPIDGLVTNDKCSYGKAFNSGDFKGWRTVTSLHNHIKLHCNSDRSIVPDLFFSNHKRSWCNGCRKLYATSQSHKHSTCQQIFDSIEEEAPENEIAALDPSQLRPLPSTDEIFSRSCNQVKAIPGKLRRQWNDLVLSLGEKIIEFNDNYHWKLLVMVSKLIWHTPMRGGNSNSNRKLNKFIRRIDLFNKGEYGLLWDEFIEEFEVQDLLNKQNEHKNHLDPQRTDYYEKLEERRAKAAVYYARNSDLSGGMRALTSFGVLPLNDKNKLLIQQLHPHEDEIKIDIDNDYINIIPIHLTPDITLSSIKEYKITTGAGADGFRPYYLNAFIGDYKQDALINMWNKLENLLLSGKACSDLFEWFGDCTGTLLAKNIEHTKGRPIGAGLCIRRTATRGIVKTILDEVNNEVFPLQIGAAKNGPELLVHTLRTVTNKFEDDFEKAFLSVDEKNAFNEMFRNYIRKVVNIYTPKILPFYDLIYARWSKIFYSKDFHVLSKRGYQQGDGLASFGFGLALYHKFKDHPELLQILLNIWYHDDGGMFCDIKKMNKIATLIKELSAEVGLELNTIKTKIYSVSNVEVEFNCTKIYEMNFEIVGSFIGDKESTQLWLNERLHEYKLILSSIKNIKDPQVQLSYLYYCCNYSKVMYLMRTIPPDYLHEFCMGYDKLVRDLFENIIQSPICNFTYKQVSLNFKNGGIGLRASLNHHLAAYLSSFSQCEGRIIDLLVNKNNFKVYDNLDVDSWTIDEFNNVVNEIHSLGDVLCDEFDISKSLLNEQKTISALIDDKLGLELFDMVNTQDKARLNACSAPGAAAWISSIPSYRFKIPPAEFLVIIRMWLGIELFKCEEQFINCTACNKKVADPFGLHYIVCKVTKGIYYGMTKRHNCARNLLFDWMKLAIYDPEKEKHGLCINVGKHCPADIYVPIYHDGLPAAIDIGITSPLQLKYINDASKEVLTVGNKYHDAKLLKYRNIIDHELLIYKPFIIEAFGGFTEEAQAILKKLCYDLKGRMRMDFSHLYNLKRREMVVKLWRANAKMVLDRLPSFIS